MSFQHNNITGCKWFVIFSRSRNNDSKSVSKRDFTEHPIKMHPPSHALNWRCSRRIFSATYDQEGKDHWAKDLLIEACGIQLNSNTPIRSFEALRVVLNDLDLVSFLVFCPISSERCWYGDSRWSKLTLEFKGDCPKSLGRTAKTKKASKKNRHGNHLNDLPKLQSIRHVLSLKFCLIYNIKVLTYLRRSQE